MIALFYKYGVIIFWAMLLAINTVIFKIPGNYAYVFLGTSLALSLYVIYRDPKLLTRRAFAILWIITLINVVYWLFFDNTYNSMLYVAAKLSTFLLIMISINYYYDFLVKNFTKIVTYIGFFVLLVGAVLNTHYFGGRYTGPFGNPNSLGWLSSLMFGLTYLTKEKSYKKYALLIFFLSMIMMSGSRVALGGAVLAILLKGRLSLNKILLLGFALGTLLLAQNIASHFGIHTGLERIVKSEKSHELLSGREQEYALGLLTIKESPLTGHGLDKYAWISPEVIRVSGLLRKDPFFAANPHNSYIAMFIMYGTPIGSIVLLTLLYYLFKIIRSHVPPDTLFMVLFSFLAAFFESYLFGVSGFESLIFWFSLPLALMYITKVKEISTTKQIVENSYK